MAVAERHVALPQAEPSARRLPRPNVLQVIVLAFVSGWFFGLAPLVWPATGFVLLLTFLLRRHVEMPRGFGLWLLFLLWVPLSIVQVPDLDSSVVFAHRYLGLLAATAIFLFVFTVPRSRLPDRAVVDALALFWALVVLAGLLAVVLPEISYHTPAEALLPASIGGNPYVHGALHARFADIQTLLGFPLGRPSILFTATNAWGAMVALLVPFAFASLQSARSAAHRRALQVTLVLSVIPVVISLNRGTWIAIGAAGAYVAIRMALRADLRAVAAFAAFVAVTALLVTQTPLYELVQGRIDNPQSNESRQTLYEEALSQVERSPLYGWGGPSPSERNVDGPPVGTHSHILFLAYSHGIPALLLAFGWLGMTFVRSLRATGPAFWAHVTLLVFFVVSPYYLLEAHLPVVMIAAALVWRHLSDPPGRAP